MIIMKKISLLCLSIALIVTLPQCGQKQKKQSVHPETEKTVLVDVSAKQEASPKLVVAKEVGWDKEEYK